MCKKSFKYIHNPYPNSAILKTFYDIVDASEFRENFLKVNVFYEDLNQETYSERPAVPVSEFISS